MYAIQTTEDVVELTNRDIINMSIPAVKAFWDKGQRVFKTHLEALISERKDAEKLVILEFGCGVSRILVNFRDFKGKKLGVDVSKTQIRYARRIAPEIQYSLVKKS